MRELDFLPEWYKQTVRHRRLVLWQGGATVAVMLGTFLVFLVMHHRIESARAGLASVQNGLREGQTQSKQMRDLTARRDQWIVQERLLDTLGLHMEAARLISALDTAMPPEVSLVGLQIDSDEIVKPGSHRLRVRIQGIAPTDADLSRFMTRLGKRSIFEQVTAGYVKEFSENGHLLRSFEVSFSMDLNAPMVP